MKIIFPKRLCVVEKNYGPLFYLAGPVDGCDDWRTKCCERIRNRIPNFYAVLPGVSEEGHPLNSFLMEGENRYFYSQIPWEDHYKDIASKTGCIIFWLPKDSKNNPAVGADPYAMTIRDQVGEWRGRFVYNRKIQMVVGIEPGFPGQCDIEDRFNFATRSYFPVYSTLAETVTAAASLVKM